MTSTHDAVRRYIAQMRKIEGAATPKPWAVEQSNADDDLTAASRNSLLALLDVAEALNDMLDLNAATSPAIRSANEREALERLGKLAPGEGEAT